MHTFENLVNNKKTIQAQYNLNCFFNQKYDNNILLIKTYPIVNVMIITNEIIIFFFLFNTPSIISIIAAKQNIPDNKWCGKLSNALLKNPTTKYFFHHYITLTSNIFMTLLTRH